MSISRHGEQARAAATQAGDDAERLARRSSGWLVPLGRAGYAANGLVYAIVGALAVQAAIGIGGDITDTNGALGHIIDAPGGRWLLGGVAVGLLGYALWRVLQAVLDTEHKGTQPGGLLARAGYAFAAVVYGGLALSAVAMALGRGSQPDGEQSTQDRTAWLMSQPFGHWLVMLVGLATIAAGVSQLVRAYRAPFRDELRTDKMRPQEQRLALAAGRLGYAARGVVFGLVGLFLVIAGVQAQPEEARGLGGALAALAQQPFGPWLLGVVGLGLLAYGAFLLVEAAYRRMVV